jgi:hypothetical protein
MISRADLRVQQERKQGLQTRLAMAEFGKISMGRITRGENSLAEIGDAPDCQP